MTFEEVLRKGIELGASDFHLSSYDFPAYRVKKKLVVCRELGILEENVILRFLREKGLIEEDFSDVDTSFEFDGYRFRASIFKTRKGTSVVLRKLPKSIPDLENLNLPAKFIEHLFTDEGKLKVHSGLILITGETNSGKSTTLASLLKKTLENNPKVVITLEDPVEYDLYPAARGKAKVYQREVGKDTESFARGLKSALREDPDIVLVGEIRDAETMRTALNASMTGHVVLATLHTNDTVSTIDRIRNMFPDEEQNSILDALSRSLYLIQSQRLYANEKGEIVPIVELLKNTKTVATLIREKKIFRITPLLDEEPEHISWDRCLVSLFNQGKLSYNEAVSLAKDPQFVRERTGDIF